MRLLLLSAAFAGLAAPALAEGPTVTGGIGLSLTTEEDRGARQNANAYLEAELNGFYGGLSFDAYRDSTENELDLYLGYRTTLGSVDLDTSYTRYNYPNAGGDCCGDVNLNLGMPVGPVTASLDLNYYPEDKTSDAGITLDYTLPANDKLTLTTSYTLNNGVGGDKSGEWELSAAYQVGENSTLAGHIYDGTDYKPYVEVDLNWDFTLLGG